MTSEPLVMCPSCLNMTECESEWLMNIPRPDGIGEGLICADCHASLVRYAELDL